jgi:hypothetical protein
LQSSQYLGTLLHDSVVHSHTYEMLYAFELLTLCTQFYE